MKFVIFNLETTGVWPHADDIIQISAVRMQDGEVVAGESFASYVRPRKDLSAAVTELTGITSADVRDAPEPMVALEAFSRFVGDSTLVANYLGLEDLEFFRACCQRHQLSTRELPFLDPHELFWPIFKSGTYQNRDAIRERLAHFSASLWCQKTRGDARILAEGVADMWRLLGATPERCPAPVKVLHLPLDVRDATQDVAPRE
jgi:DNA polymerase III alpha subunit (gram-positive type)